MHGPPCADIALLTTNGVGNAEFCKEVLDTGELRRGHQAVAHDLFDRDTVLTAVADLGGDPRSQVIISTGKLGRVIGLDPKGNVLWDTPVGMHQNDDVASFEHQLKVMPGPLGGVLTPIAVAEVLRLIAAVKTDREIADELVISFRTVGNHVRSILNKTSVVNRTEAATYAARNDLL